VSNHRASESPPWGVGLDSLPCARSHGSSRLPFSYSLYCVSCGSPVGSLFCSILAPCLPIVRNPFSLPFLNYFCRSMHKLRQTCKSFINGITYAPAFVPPSHLFSFLKSPHVPPFVAPRYLPSYIKCGYCVSSFFSQNFGSRFSLSPFSSRPIVHFYRHDLPGEKISLPCVQSYSRC
jgi:hypothetical protein